MYVEVWIKNINKRLNLCHNKKKKKGGRRNHLLVTYAKTKQNNGERDNGTAISVFS